MPGRGRGSFGTKFSFDLAALGFGGKFGLSQLTSAQAPPSSFPPLDAKPANLIEDNEHEYLVELSRNFQSLVNDSPFYLRPLKAPKPFIERYADVAAAEAEKAEAKLARAANKGKPAWPPVDQWPIDWERFPMELRPASMRSAGGVTLDAAGKNGNAANDNNARTPKTAKKKKGAANKNDDDDEVIGSPSKKRRLRVKDEEVDDETIQKRLADLEKQETSGDVTVKQEMVDVAEGEESSEEQDAEGEVKNKKKNKAIVSDDEDGADEEADDADPNAEEDYDEEMGDYGDDYFDNGEGYEDDDDGDNEGPTY